MEWQSEARDQMLTITMPTSLDMIDLAIERSCAFVMDFNLPTNPDLKIVIRELLMNAMTHGNRHDPSKPVFFRMSYCGQNRFKIEVKDAGNGFDYQRLNFLVTEEDQNTRKKRGLVLVNSLAEGLFFSEAGNFVTVFVTLGHNWPRKEDNY